MAWPQACHSRAFPPPPVWGNSEVITSGANNPQVSRAVVIWAEFRGGQQAGGLDQAPAETTSLTLAGCWLDSTLDTQPIQGTKAKRYSVSFEAKMVLFVPCWGPRDISEAP